MKRITENSDWDYIVDNPEDFNSAIDNAATENERTFFKTLKEKVIHEPAFSNDVLMKSTDNQDGIYILRVSDDFLIGRKDINDKDILTPTEYSGLFNLLASDMKRLINRNISVGEWLRERDYDGIDYNANNDYR